MAIYFSCTLPESYNDNVLDGITAHEIGHMLGIKKQLKADEYSARLLGTGKGLLEFLVAKRDALAKLPPSGWVERMKMAIHTREPSLMPKTLVGRLVARFVFALKSDNASLYKRISRLRELEKEIEGKEALGKKNGTT